MNNFYFIKTEKIYLQASLYKIGANDNDIARFVDSSNISEMKYIYVCDDNSSVYNYMNFGYMPASKIGKDYFIDSGYTYKGEIEITQYDIDKYNMRNELTVYNL